MAANSPTSPAQSLFGRAVCAVALMIGFYLLALLIAAGLAWIPFAEMHYAHRVHIKLAFICVASACVIIWSILPRIDRFQAPGPRLLPGEHPKLFESLRRIASSTQQAMPVEVYLCPEVNAWVAQRGGIMGFGSRRVMGLGLPLMQVFTVSEFEAVLAHEFGHYHGGDTKLGPWIFKTRAMIGRTLQGLGDSILQKPFLWYGMLYLRITHAISRRQEYMADELAARTVGAKPLIKGLEKVHRAALGFQAYLDNEFAPALASGVRAPFLEGYTRFCAVPKIQEAVAKSLEEELKDSKADPYDTHPVLKDRIAALEALTPTPRSTDDTPAITLLSDYERYEVELLTALTGNTKVGEMPAIGWHEMGPKVYLPLWRKNLKLHAEVFSGKTVEHLYSLAQDPESFAKQIAPESADAATSEQKINATSNIVGAALAVTLAENGWGIEAELGENIRLHKQGLVIEPFTLSSQLAVGKLSKADWDASLREENQLRVADFREKAAAVA